MLFMHVFILIKIPLLETDISKKLKKQTTATPTKTKFPKKYISQND